MGYYIFIGFYILVFFVTVGALVTLIRVCVKQEKQEKERERKKEKASFKNWLEKVNDAAKHNAIVNTEGKIVDPWLQYNEDFKKFLDLSKTKYKIDYRYVINDFEKILEKEQVIIILEDYEVVVAAFDKWLAEEFQKKVDRKLQFIKLNEVKYGTTT